jgi:hypothetical protein
MGVRDGGLDRIAALLPEPTGAKISTNAVLG